MQTDKQKKIAALQERQDILRSAYPIVKMIVHEKGIEVRREAKGQLKGIIPPSDNKIVKLSKSSLSRLAFIASVTSARFTSMLTLTYCEIETDGKKVKGDLNLFLTKLRNHFKPVSYLWFLEFQKRGAPHFHLLTNIEIDNVSRETIAEMWATTIATSGKEYLKVRNVHRHEKQMSKIKKPDGAKRYALKYALKPHQKTVPEKYRNVGRFWGNSRDVKPSEGIEVDVTESELRQWIAMHEPEINDRLPVLLPKYIIRR